MFIIISLDNSIYQRRLLAGSKSLLNMKKRSMSSTHSVSPPANNIG